MLLERLTHSLDMCCANKCYVYTVTEKVLGLLIIHDENTRLK
jgi:hypothetical protein